MIKVGDELAGVLNAIQEAATEYRDMYEQAEMKLGVALRALQLARDKLPVGSVAYEPVSEAIRTLTDL